MRDLDLDFVTEDETGIAKSESVLLKGQVQALSLRKKTAPVLRSIVLVDGVEARAQEGPEWE